ncbi:hypothetical protein NKJ23_32220 [Mesorhizobium sp. M0184]|uniref:hypothetical protein n=1 Tax=unclassified Mesorhizobium TaxID=325217 RepID=UPI003339C4A8
MPSGEQINSRMAKLINMVYYCEFDQSFAQTLVGDLKEIELGELIHDELSLFDLLSVPYLILSSMDGYRERSDSKAEDCDKIESICGEIYVLLKEKIVNSKFISKST